MIKGLIKALMTAGSSVVADQWKEFFYCDALDTDTLAVISIPLIPEIP